MFRLRTGHCHLRSQLYRLGFVAHTRLSVQNSPINPRAHPALLMCPQPDMSTVRYVHSPICPRPDMSMARYVHSLICPRPDMSAARYVHGRYVHSLICPQPDMSTARYVHGPIYPRPDMSTAWYVHGPTWYVHGPICPQPVCPRPDMSTARYVHCPIQYVHGLICPQPDMSTARYVHGPICPRPICPQPNMSTARYVHSLICPRPILCPQPDMFTARQLWRVWRASLAVLGELLCWQAGQLRQTWGQYHGGRRLSFADDGNPSWYSVCRVPIVEWRLDCENCRHLTVVSLRDTSPWCRWVHCSSSDDVLTVCSPCAQVGLRLNRVRTGDGDPVCPGGPAAGQVCPGGPAAKPCQNRRQWPGVPRCAQVGLRLYPVRTGDGGQVCPGGPVAKPCKTGNGGQVCPGGPAAKPCQNRRWWPGVPRWACGWPGVPRWACG